MNSKTAPFSLIVVLACASPASATFHLMQIEQVIGGVNGDTSAQAIQLRMRAHGQDLVSLARVRAWDAAGNNPVLIVNFTSNVPVAAAGSRILLATTAFTTEMKSFSASFSPDFGMPHPIPSSYLDAGRLTFENDSGDVFWSFAWGGSAYTGSHLGTTDNDANGNFGPAYANALPITSRQGVRFKGPAGALSVTNVEDYAPSANPATVVRNNGNRFIIGPVPEIAVEQPVGNVLLDGESRKSFGSVPVSSDGKRKTFTIRNLGTGSLTGFRITKTGLNPGDFIVTAPTKSSIPAGGATTFKVRFDPRAKGTRRAAIHIRSNDADENPFDIKLMGAGVK